LAIDAKQEEAFLNSPSLPPMDLPSVSIDRASLSLDDIIAGANVPGIPAPAPDATTDEDDVDFVKRNIEGTLCIPFDAMLRTFMLLSPRDFWKAFFYVRYRP